MVALASVSLAPSPVAAAGTVVEAGTGRRGAGRRQALQG